MGHNKRDCISTMLSGRSLHATKAEVSLYCSCYHKLLYAAVSTVHFTPARLQLEFLARWWKAVFNFFDIFHYVFATRCIFSVNDIHKAHAKLVLDFCLLSFQSLLCILIKIQWHLGQAERKQIWDFVLSVIE